MKISNKIICVYIIVSFFVGIMFYPILPKILNYPPDSINNEFQSNIDLGLSYNTQFFIIIFIGAITGIITLKLLLKQVDKLQKEGKEYLNNKSLNKIFELPTKIYIIEIVLPFFLIITMYAISELNINVGTIKIGIIIATFETLVSLILYIFFNNEIKKMFIRLNIFETPNIKKVSLRRKMLVILLPIIFVALVITAFIGYMRIVEDTGTQVHKNYKNILKNVFVKSEYTENEVKQILSKIEIEEGQTQIIIYNNENYLTYDNSKLSKFFIKYTLEKSESEDNRTFDTYAIDTLGTVLKIKIDNKTAYIGVKYPIYSKISIIYLFISSVILMIVNIIILYYYIRSLTKDISYVSNSMLEISSENTIDINKKIPISSDDEIGDLTTAFNKIRDKTNTYITQIQYNQEMITKQAQLATLGELAGGMAHDINTPIASINMCIKTMERTVTDEVNKELLKSMETCTEHIIGIVNSLRDQIRNIGDKQKQTFFINKILENLEIMTVNEFNKNNCKLEINSNEDLKIFGEANKLTQVIINIVMNSVQAYSESESENRRIIISTKSDKDNNIIEIKDFAGGIPDRIAPHMFKDILTTKGSKGTGIGMYISYSIVKGVFGGEITFETEKGVGTQFNIYIPKNKEGGELNE